MVLLIVVDFVFVGVIIVSVGVGVEQVVAVCAVSIGGPDEPAVSEVVILECCELGRIGVIAHVVLFDGHAPPRLIGVFSTAEGQELNLGGVDVEYFGLFVAGKLFATGWVGGLRSRFFGLFLSRAEMNKVSWFDNWMGLSAPFMVVLMVPKLPRL
ncbi:MAG: hypothetical protein RI977_1568 [Bacteroidota bacterium]